MVVMDHLCMLELQKCMHASMFLSALGQFGMQRCMFEIHKCVFWNHKCMFLVCESQMVGTCVFSATSLSMFV